MWELISSVLPMVIGMMNKGGKAETSSMGSVNTAPANYYKTQGSGIWDTLGKVLPSVAGALGGGNQSSPATNPMAGQQPQQPFIPSTMMQSRQMPSYGGVVQQMLSKQRGF